METKQDISYGIIPLFHDGDEWRILVVYQISYRGDDFWTFPKGHAEEGECGKEAALRELREETGITSLTLLDNKKIIISYSYVHDGVDVEKSVEYFVGLCESKDTHISQPNEIKELRWCSHAEAKKLLTHQNSRDVLNNVLTHLLDYDRQ